MECVTSVTYSLLINGEPYGSIKPSKGIRQGDPLSSYLFLLCLEGLHRMIQKVASNGDIQGVSICHNGPKLTHLFLQMIAFCFVGPPHTIVKKCWRFYSLMKEFRGRN